MEKIIMETKPSDKYQILEYYEQHKDEIMADYISLGLNALLGKWHMAALTWGKLRKEWGIEGKRRGPKKRLASEGASPLTEHERYLVLLGYQQAMREILGHHVKSNI